MAKLSTAAEFIDLVKSGKYETSINAKRGCGRTHLSDAEKKKAFDYIDKHFGDSPAEKKASGPHGGERLTKPTKKKVVGKKKGPGRPRTVKTDLESEEQEDQDNEVEAVEEAPKRRAKAAPPPGTLNMSPSEVKTVADILGVIDATVNRSVSVIEALRQANELNNNDDIAEGVGAVKKSLTDVARLINSHVVGPLLASGTQSDPEVAQRLEAVVAASNVHESHLNSAQS